MDTIPPPITTVEKDDRTWAMLAHLSGLLGICLGGIGHIICPLVIWLVKKDTSAFVSDQAKESLNCQISITIYYFVSFLFCLVAVPAFLAVAVFDIVIVIIAAMKANEGIAYRYPYIIRFVK